MKPGHIPVPVLCTGCKRTIVGEPLTYLDKPHCYQCLTIAMLQDQIRMLQNTVQMLLDRFSQLEFPSAISTSKDYVYPEKDPFDWTKTTDNGGLAYNLEELHRMIRGPRTKL